MPHLAICPPCKRVESGPALKARTVAREHNDSEHDGEEVARVVAPRHDDIQEFLGWLSCKYDRETYIAIHERVIDADPAGSRG